MATIMNCGRANAVVSVNTTTYLSNGSGQFTAADGDVFQLVKMGCWVAPTLGVNDVQAAPFQSVNIGGAQVVAGPDGVIRGLTMLQAIGARISIFFAGAMAPLSQQGTAPTSSGGGGSSTVASPTPISPDAITSSPVVLDARVSLSTVFTDAAGTVAATKVGQSILCVRDNSGAIAATATAATAPTLAINAASGSYVLTGDGATTVMTFVNKFDPGSLGIVGYLDQAGQPARGYTEVLFGYSDATFSAVHPSGLGDMSVIQYKRARSDGSTVVSRIPKHAGAMECLLMRSDGTNYEIDRSGVKAAASVAAATGSPTALNSGLSATLFAQNTTGTTIANFARGGISAIFATSGRISDAEMPGVSQWMVNRAKQQQTLNGWLGVFFQGNSGVNEASTAHAPVLAHFDAALQNAQYRPSSAPYRNGSSEIYADYGLATDGTSLYMTYDGDKITPRLLKCTDGFNFTALKDIDVSALGANAYGIAPTFARNYDNTIYTDSSGRATLFFDSTVNGSAFNYLCAITSVDGTWNTGGAWQAPVVLNISTAPSGVTGHIDPSVMYDQATSQWFCFFSDYTVNLKNGQIRYATAPTLSGLWTICTSTDPFNFGPGFEGAEVVNMGGGQLGLLVDTEGNGYCVATSTTGMAGFGPLPASSIIAPFTMEQGEVCPIPANFPNPCLQAASAPSPIYWKGKGRFIGRGDFSENAGSGGNGWSLQGYSPSGGPFPTIAATGVADPAGNPTATTINFPASDGTDPHSYYVHCNTDTPADSATSGIVGINHEYVFWAQGLVGGEVLTIVILDAAYGNVSSTTKVTLTKGWQRIVTRCTLTSGAGTSRPAKVAIGSETVQPAISVNLAWPTAQ